MQYKEFFLSELDREMPKTRTLLALVPEGKYDWKPHEKSSTLGGLANHIAYLTGFAITMAEDEVYDFSQWKQQSLHTADELVALFDDLSQKTRAAIEALSEEDFQKTWAMATGGNIMASFQKWDALQNIYLHHLIHHRAQLSVYLRLLDIAIPGMYGPSADEQ